MLLLAGQVVGIDRHGFSHCSRTRHIHSDLARPQDLGVPSAKAIQVENPGASYALKLAETDKPAPKAGEVLIQVAAAGLNHADLIQAKGMYPPPPGASPILGMEVSGTVEALGEGVSDCEIGDKVCALIPGGGYAEYAVAAASCVLPVPKGVSLIDAAALPEVHFTVWTNLMDAARLKRGESVLIHGGSSGIGSRRDPDALPRADTKCSPPRAAPRNAPRARRSARQTRHQLPRARISSRW